MGNNSITDTIDNLIRKNLSFACYFSPGDEEPDLVVQTAGPLFRAESYEELNGRNGFVFAPFTINHHTPLVVIRPDLHFRGFSAIGSLDTEALTTNTIPQASRRQSLPQAMDKAEYIHLAEPLLQMIQDGEFEKVVLSRTLCVDLPENRTPGQTLLKLKSKVDNAFVCLVHLPEIGTWIGATPELLLKKRNESFFTVSLAGTLPVSSDDNTFNWTAKEFREQEIVTEFIETQLKNFGIDEYRKNGPFTAFAGNVAHLKTEFEFADDKVNAELGRFITALHPTSAVCGSSREKARSYIISEERHDREYYCGFLGEWNLAGKLNLYVNIRCMKMIENRACLFVGGGITAESVLENEWEETNHKAQTLLSILT